MNTLPSACKSNRSLEEYLKEKGKNHNHYKLYSSALRIRKILETKYIYLNTGKGWNDTKDRTQFNSTDADYLNFGTCFSYSREESVAMWMLYGGVKKMEQ